jgi:hypothetical protein
MFDAGNDDNHANAFTEAFTKQTGFSKAAMTLYQVWRPSLSRYVNKGGMRSELQRVFDRLLSESTLNDDVSASTTLPKGPSDCAPASSPSTSEPGRANDAQPRQHTPARPAGNSPSTKPAIINDPGKDRIKGMIDAKQNSADAIFDTFKVRDGRAIGNVLYGELERLATKNRVEAAIFTAIHKRGVAAHDTPIRLLIKPKLLETIVRNAQEKHG